MDWVLENDSLRLSHTSLTANATNKRSDHLDDKKNAHLIHEAAIAITNVTPGIEAVGMETKRYSVLTIRICREKVHASKVSWSFGTHVH
jgi:hypothetical protein